MSQIIAYYALGRCSETSLVFNKSAVLRPLFKPWFQKKFDPA